MSDDHLLLRSELTAVYVEPVIGPRDIVAYYPETHASSNCSRSISGGKRYPVDQVPIEIVWCERCTTDEPDQATLRRVDNEWRAA